MKIILFKDQRHIVLQVAKIDHHENIVVYDENYSQWTQFIIDIANDLKDRPGVRRMSYDTWWWDERKSHEAEEYVTYFYLKHGE